MTPLARRVDEARLALMFLTRLPVGRIADPAPSLADARWAYPLVGIVVGLVGWAAHQGALALGLDPLVAALTALFSVALLTGGLHHDGLADFADGMGGGRNAEHCLEIMRDSRIGSYGVLALIFAVALSAGALAALDEGAPLTLFLTVGVGSRLAMLMVLDLLPAARTDGLGHGASGTNFGAWLPGLAVLAALGLFGGPALWLILLGAVGTATVIAQVARRRIGGQTGDVLGAVQLASETLTWIAAAAILATGG